MKEVTVSIKNSEQTYKEKFLIYDNFSLDQNDPIVKNCVEEAISHFKGEIEKIVLRVRMDIQ